MHTPGRPQPHQSHSPTQNYDICPCSFAYNLPTLNIWDRLALALFGWPCFPRREKKRNLWAITIKIKKIGHTLGHLFISGMYHGPFLPNCVFALLLTNAHSNSLSREQPTGRCELRSVAGSEQSSWWENRQARCLCWPRSQMGLFRLTRGRGLPSTKPRTTCLFGRRKIGKRCLCVLVQGEMGVRYPPHHLFCRGFKVVFEYVCEMGAQRSPETAR